jgi:Flp pilus assembly protein TadD
MGLSSLKENNITNALIELTEAEKLTPDDPKVLNSLGLAYFKKNKFELAEQRFRKAVSTKHDFSEARNNLGLCYLAMSRWDDAVQQFKIVADDIFYPDQETAAINLGRAYFGKGDYERALTVFRSSVAGNTGNPIARLDLGRVYYATGKTDLAIVEYKKAIALNNNYAKAYYYLGLAYVKIKDNESAKSAFREVIRIVPDLEIGQLARENLDMLK